MGAMHSARQRHPRPTSTVAIVAAEGSRSSAGRDVGELDENEFVVGMTRSAAASDEPK
jgi:hypothetical protein